MSSNGFSSRTLRELARLARIRDTAATDPDYCGACPRTRPCTQCPGWQRGADDWTAESVMEAMNA